MVRLDLKNRADSAVTDVANAIIGAAIQREHSPCPPTEDGSPLRRIRPDNPGTRIGLVSIAYHRRLHGGKAEHCLSSDQMMLALVPQDTISGLEFLPWAPSLAELPPGDRRGFSFGIVGKDDATARAARSVLFHLRHGAVDGAAGVARVDLVLGLVGNEPSGLISSFRLSSFCWNQASVADLNVSHRAVKRTYHER